VRAKLVKGTVSVGPFLLDISGECAGIYAGYPGAGRASRPESSPVRPLDARYLAL